MRGKQVSIYKIATLDHVYCDLEVYIYKYHNNKKVILADKLRCYGFYNNIPQTKGLDLTKRGDYLKTRIIIACPSLTERYIHDFIDKVIHRHNRIGIQQRCESIN